MKSKNFLLAEHLQKEMQIRNYSPRSIHTYGSLMLKLEQYFNISLDKITTSQFKDYLHHRITNDSVSVSMINQSISAFKILQTDILGREWEPLKIKRPRREKKLPVILSLNEIENLISVTSNLKHRALLMLAYSSGLRRQEVQHIKPSAIDSELMQVHVSQAKGHKDRYTILSAKTLDVLRIYYKYHKPLHYLFESQTRKGHYLSATTLNKIVKINSAKAGIKKDVSFHTLRHCFATHLLEQGINLRLIQKFMGHVSLKTTSVYLHLANVEPASITSPIDSMNV